MITMTAVKSSQIAAVGYDAGAQTLAVQFVRGYTYHYTPVPEAVYQGLLAAESVGKFFGANVKNAPEIKCTRQQEAA
jgi:hypothetical protein